MKPKSNNDVLDMYYKLTCPKKVHVLMGAISEMQSYNGRTVNDCIIYAMGYTPSGYAGCKWEKP